MAFDAEAPARTAHILCAIPAPTSITSPDLSAAIVFAGDPDVEWATRHPDRLLAFLYVSPRPCAALDALLDL